MEGGLVDNNGSKGTVMTHHCRELAEAMGATYCFMSGMAAVFPPSDEFPSRVNVFFSVASTCVSQTSHSRPSHLFPSSCFLQCLLCTSLSSQSLLSLTA